MSADPSQPAPKPSGDAKAGATPSPGLKAALEFGPLLLFFVAFKVWDIYVATGVMIGTTAITVTVTRVREKRWPVMGLVTAVLVGVFGGLTIYLHNDTFLKMKVTLLNALFGTVLLAGLALGKPLIKTLMGEAVHLAPEGWTKLTKLYIVFFYALAGINEIVWRNTTTDTWVKFKTFGLPALLIAFVVVQAPVIAKHDLSEREPETEPDA